MRPRAIIVIALVLPAALAGQSPAVRNPPDGVMLEFVRFANIFGSRLVTAFDSIPADKYDYRPTPPQQTIGYIAQHLENANYSLCERLGDLKHPRTAKDSLADTVKARWPKDTLIKRLTASLRFCDDAMERLDRLQSAALASVLLAIETDLAEHYSQIAVYMRLLGMVPPSALPPKRRTAIELPATSLPPYVGAYQLATGLEIEVTVRDGMLFIRSTSGGGAVRLWPESRDDFFINEADAQLTFTRNASGAVTGLVLHQYGRDRPARKVVALAPARGAQPDPRIGCYRADRPLGTSASAEGVQGPIGERIGEAGSALLTLATFQLLEAGRVDRPGTVMHEWWVLGSRWVVAGDTLNVRLSTLTSGWDLRLVPARGGGDTVYVGDAHYLSDAIRLDARGNVVRPPPVAVRVARERCAPPT